MDDKSISELWTEFQASILKREAHRRDAKIPGMNLSLEIYNTLTSTNEFLRAELLERCKPWIAWRADGSIYARITFVPSNADAYTLRKCASICEFAAWELDQRQKEREVQDGNN